MNKNLHQQKLVSTEEKQCRNNRKQRAVEIVARPQPYKGGCGDMLHLKAEHVMNHSDCHIAMLGVFSVTAGFSKGD
jgi:hypothetical protein